MPVTSHKQISEFLLKRFSTKEIVENVEPKTGKIFKNKANLVWFLDLKKGKIEQKFIGDINTEFGFFSDSIEKLLSQKEGGWATLLRDLDKWESRVKRGENITFEFGKYKEMLDEFLKLSLVRADNILKDIKERSLSVHLIKGTPHYDKIFCPDNLVKIMLNKPILKKEMEKYTINVMLNVSSKNFITSKNCWYSAYENSSDQQIIFPIDSKKAIVWYDKKFDSRYKLPDGNIGTQAIKSDHGICNLNKYCLRSQIHSDNEFVIAERKEELEELLNIINSIE